MAHRRPRSRPTFGRYSRSLDPELPANQPGGNDMSSLKPMRQPQTRNRQVRRNSRASVSPPGRSPLPIFYAIFALIIVVGVVLLAVRARQGSPLAPSNVPVDQAVRPLNAPVGQTADGY